MATKLSVNNTTALLSDVIAWMKSPNDALRQRPLGRLITRADTALQYRLVIRCITTQTSQQLDHWRYEDMDTLRGLTRRLRLWTMESRVRDGWLVHILHPVPKKEYFRQIRRYTIAVLLRKGLVKDIARKIADDLCREYQADWAHVIKI